MGQEPARRDRVPDARVRTQAVGTGGNSMRPTLPLLLLSALAAGCASTPPEQDPVQIKLNDLETRLARTERIAANDVQVSQRLDEIQNNVRELRGRLEELEHGNEALSKQQ